MAEIPLSPEGLRLQAPPMDMSVEVWLPVVGFEGYYEVSNWGRVKVVCSGRNRIPQSVLSYKRAGKGYAAVTLCVDGEKKRFYVHRLVARAFIGSVPEGKEVLHADDTPFNCRLDNLRYDTHEKNLRDAVSTGCVKVGEASVLAKLKAEDVRVILASREFSRLLGERFNVSRQTIDRVRKRRTYANVSL